MLLFVFKNKKWLTIAPDNLYKIAYSVAESPPSDRDTVIMALKMTIKQHLVPRDYPTS